jgi:hypothetical protein
LGIDFPLTKVIGQGAQAAIELSYEHFPKATEKTLDLIAQVGNGLDVTVKSLHNPDCCYQQAFDFFVFLLVCYLSCYY